jgi:hypothetical protein
MNNVKLNGKVALVTTGTSGIDKATAIAFEAKRQDEPDKANRALQRPCREFIKLMEFWYEWLDSGKSFEELAIMLDILAAGGAIPERERDVSHKALGIIRKAREQGADRNEVMAYMRELERKLNAPAGETMTQLFFSFA